MAQLLLLEAAWLRRDAIASYVCLVCCNSQLNNSKSQAKPRIIPNISNTQMVMWFTGKIRKQALNEELDYKESV